MVRSFSDLSSPFPFPFLFFFSLSLSLSLSILLLTIQRRHTQYYSSGSLPIVPHSGFDGRVKLSFSALRSPPCSFSCNIRKILTTATYTNTSIMFGIFADLLS